MNLVAALILFNILILIYQILIQVFSVLFVLTGVNLEKAKFQVISMLTGTGFTTSESEAIVMTKKRRKLAQNMMLFSYIFNISIVSTFVTMFASTSSASFQEFKIGILYTIVNLLVMYWLNRSKSFRKFLDKTIFNIINKNKSKLSNHISLYDLYGNKVIAEINLKILPPNLKSVTIEELYTEHHIQVLVIKRGEAVISEVKHNYILREDDVITVFGKLNNIKQLFELEKATAAPVTP